MESNAYHIIPSYRHLPVSCRNLFDLCGSLGSCKPQIIIIIIIIFSQFSNLVSKPLNTNNWRSGSSVSFSSMWNEIKRKQPFITKKVYLTETIDFGIIINQILKFRRLYTTFICFMCARYQSEIIFFYSSLFSQFTSFSLLFLFKS